jgi:hypothetical protein
VGLAVKVIWARPFTVVEVAGKVPAAQFPAWQVKVTTVPSGTALFSTFLTSAVIFDVAEFMIVAGTAVTLTELGALEMLMVVDLGVKPATVAWSVAVPDVPPA